MQSFLSGNSILLDVLERRNSDRANLEAPSGEQWKVPLGAGVGKVLRIGKLPINVNLQYYDYVETPTYGPDWQVRLQIQFLFPK